jgi:hypothetical protein
MKTKLPLFILIALGSIVLLGGIALAAVTATRTGHITRPITAQLSILPTETQSLTWASDQETGTVVYTVSNPGFVPYTAVSVLPTSLTTGMTITTDKTGFPLGNGASDTVTLTITFTDGALTSGDYSVEFSAT